MATKKITYNFFQITPLRNSSISAKQIQSELNGISKMQEFPSQHLTNRILFVLELKSFGSFYVGTAILSQMNNISGSVDYETRKIAPLPLGKNEGVLS